MTLEIENFTGAQALDIAQIIKGNSGNGWISGVEPSVDDGSSSITVEVTSGTVLIDNNEISVSAQNISLPNGDPDWPRRDAIYIDIDGTLQFEQGIPRQPDPETAVGATASVPEIPDLSGQDVAVIAALWIPTNATQGSDINPGQMLQDRRVKPWPDHIDQVVEDLEQALEDAEDIEGADPDEDVTVTGNWTYDTGTTTTFNGNVEGIDTLSESADETITGNWTFDNDLTVNSDILLGDNTLRMDYTDDMWYGVTAFNDGTNIVGRLLIDSYGTGSRFSLYDEATNTNIWQYAWGNDQFDINTDLHIDGKVQTESGDGPYDIQKDGTDGSGIINFKTE